MPLTRSVVVVGGGLAGLSAAIEAARAGAAVTLLDKEPRVGGNSARATSGMNAAPTLTQVGQGVADSVSLFVDDTTRAGKGANDPTLVEILASQSVDALAFVESFGVSLSALSRCGGHSVPRTHREKEVSGRPVAVGWDLVRALKSHVDSPNTIKVVTHARVTKLIGERGVRVDGVQFESGHLCHEMRATSVILATGGYAADVGDDMQASLINKYAPQYTKLPTTNGMFASGDGVKMAFEFGALVADLDKVQIHPTGFVDPRHSSNPVKILAPESLRAYGAILIDIETSRRFVNELATRDEVSGAMLAIQQSKQIVNHTQSPLAPTIALLLMNAKIVESYGEAAVAFYMKLGLIEKFDSLRDLTKQYELQARVLEQEIVSYAAKAAFGTADPFGKTVFPVVFDQSEPFYAALVTPVRHYTMGGVRITEEARAMTEAHTPIANLFCCGEVACGLDGANRLAGNSLLGSVVFGRIAGRISAQ
ncbi:FAD binding domain-containing protein [Chytriomyces sp. MP71]|nr:FAD binding domain-containing protein [Chytriomyces sp. MP71]